MKNKKLMLQRDCSPYGGTGYEHIKKSNQALAKAFLTKIIQDCGFTANEKAKHDKWGETTSVGIVELGGKFFLQCCNSFSEAGGNPNYDSEVEVTEFYLGNNQYYDDDLDMDVVYDGRKEAIKKLAKDINKFGGNYRKLQSGEAKYAA